MSHWVYELPNPTGPSYVGCTQLTMLQKKKEWDLHRPWFLRNNPHLVGRCPQLCHNRPLKQKTALCLEVVKTIISGGKGACYANYKLSPEQNSEIYQLKKALAGCRSTVEQIRAVAKVARGCDRAGPLRLHISNKCFKCGEKWGPTCGCRIQTRQFDRRAPVVKKRQSGRNPRTGAQRIKDMKLIPGTYEYRRFKWGKNHKKARRRDNKKRPNRGWGKRK